MLLFNYFLYYTVFICADLYPSNLEEWQPVESIVDVFECLHGSIGEQMYKGRSNTDLAENGIFFYDHSYYIPLDKGQYGHIEKLSLPAFDSLDWPLPSQSTSEAYKCRLYTEVQKSMKPNIASRQSRIAIFMPVAVFVDFFSTTIIRVTKTMFLVQNIDEPEDMQCMDKGWDTREENGVVCKVQAPSVCCKYMIANQNFILTFYYRRWHYICNRLVPLEQDMETFASKHFEIDIWYGTLLIFSINMSGNSTLAQVRADLLHEDIQLPNIYNFTLNGHKVFIYQCLFISINTNIKFSYLNYFFCR